ncbi:MAG: DUF169 domain-containing protein [Firmicutes bacterium]|nr:DUF169 domain-containing protein [Bacillota bacterium]
MSYGELIREIKLEGRLLAITRVHRDEEQLTDTFGCIYKVLKRVLAGETFVFAKDTCSCSGFDHNTGLRDDMPNTPGGFGIFLSQGSDQQWTPPGEKFKCDPQTAEDMFRCLPKEVMGDYDALKFEPYREGMKADVVVAFCNPDQLSALIVLHGYDKPEYDRVIATTVSGCASMVRIPLDELRREKPRAVITGTDLAARKYVGEGELAFAVTGPEFDKMLAVTEECFFHSPVWKPVRNRLRAEEHLEDAKFTDLA